MREKKKSRVPCKNAQRKKPNKGVLYVNFSIVFKQCILFAIGTLRYYDTKQDFLIK